MMWLRVVGRPVVARTMLLSAYSIKLVKPGFSVTVIKHKTSNRGDTNAHKMLVPRVSVSPGRTCLQNAN